MIELLEDIWEAKRQAEEAVGVTFAQLLMLGVILLLCYFIGFLYGFEKSRYDLLDAINQHQIEHEMPTITYQQLYKG